MEIVTDRLLLRPWRFDDEAPMAAINRDPEVVRHLSPGAGSEERVAAFLGRAMAHWKEHGFGWFAVERRQAPDAEALIGFAGVTYPRSMPALAERPELGWRLGRSAWGQGFATEAAEAAREDARDRLGLPPLISIIHPDNERSQRVARKLDMTVEQQVPFDPLGIDVDVWVSPR